jgi:dolichyl-phosphate beta-glucosyltransferase
MVAPHAGRIQLTVVVPAYNEERRLGSSLDLIAGYIDSRGLDAEILVVDDGSSDGTRALAQRMLAGRRGRVVSNPENRGKGYSFRRGVREAQGRWVLLTDSDLSTPIEEHERLAAVARDRDLDVVIGSRALPDSRIEVRQNWMRESMGKTFNLLIRSMTGLPFRDTQCGFNLMDQRRVLPAVERMVVNRFAFDVELLFLCHRFGLRAGEVPVTWRNDPSSRVSVLSDPINMFLDVARIRWRFRRGGYNPDTGGDGTG